ncbi:MAG: zinc D-Ala-D-Ala carboxypeptidase [Patescibacteria group bacterium]|jgi:D-alanyl-D-alanine carboxypeptidase|nr:zinc D-Ala-D-Ala carboxypeptidase [Patescibacteria group bacterium]
MTNKHNTTTVLYIIIGLCVAGLLYTGFSWSKTSKILSETLSELQAKTTEFEAKIFALEENLNLEKSEKERLQSELIKEQQKNEDFENQIDDAIDEVKDLKKLSETDEELLQKYSKVYFLNEHYIPKSLTDIDKKYLSQPTVKKQIHKEVYPFLKELMEEALDDKMTLKINSAFRSFSEQTDLKATYKVTYGTTGANTFSADQGFSEHQLGTTLDFSSQSTNYALEGFDTTKEFEWLQENAHRYGFVLSYPKGNKYYVYEPWHWRFVGTDLAKKLHKENKNFYDLEQRDIDKYLLEIFD